MHHVNLGIPPGSFSDERAFLELLGYLAVDPGDGAKGLGAKVWFSGSDGAEIHLSTDPEHRPAARAHTAVWLDDDLVPATARLRDAGYELSERTFDGWRHVFTVDPAGNRWELVGPPAARDD